MVTKFGLFGDSYGWFNSLVTALTFLGLLYTLHRQQVEGDMRAFQENFFKLLERHDELRNSICWEEKLEDVEGHPAPNRKKAGGRAAFQFMVQEMHEWVPGSDDLSDLADGYFGMQFETIVQYLAFLRAFLEFVDISKVPAKQKQRYATFLHAELSVAEQRFLFIISTVRDQRRLRKLMRKYRLLRSLPPNGDLNWYDQQANR